jgi:hypothetical protein
MTAVLTSLTAILGTLLGALATHVFQRSANRQARDFAARQQLRADRMAAYSDFAGAIAEYRRGQLDRWHRRHEDPESPAAFDARAESYRLRAAAQHALFRVELVAGDTHLIEAARQAYELTVDVHKAPARDALGPAGDRARQALHAFVTLAAADFH